MNMADNLVRLPLLKRYRFHFVMEEPVRLPHYTGSAWRGLLGHGLRRVACVTGQKQCEGCLLLDSCIYNHLFESRSQESDSGRYRVRPHPYVLEPLSTSSRQLQAGDTLNLGITLASRAEATLPFLVQGLRHAGWRGLGQRGGRFRLGGLFQEKDLGGGHWNPIWDSAQERLRPFDSERSVPPPVPQHVRIELLTPLRMKHRGRLVTPETFDAPDFLRQLWRRTQEMSRYYGGVEHDLLLPCPTEKPDDIRAGQKELHWHDWTRYSSRQGCHMQMGGLMGSWTLEGDALDRWWPLLWYGQWLHLGKATSMGLGHYRLHADGKLAGTEPVGTTS
jgi:hypothetical protein